MPNNIVKTKRQERLWKKAERLSKKKFGRVDYAYAMGIFKNMGGLKGKKNVIKEEFIQKVRYYLDVRYRRIK